VPLPTGLRQGDALREPIFTPATKASSGHDRNIGFDEMVPLIGARIAARLRDVSLALYSDARAHAASRGLVLADTKFEFGLVAGPAGDELILIDEALTPDSSRYWDAAGYARGELVSFDKQFVRNYLIEIAWDREPPAPPLPPAVVEATRARYRETYRRLTGREID
jgi:phosphoribosylaminoimidazole-succinocarboxamide synthase